MADFEIKLSDGKAYIYTPYNNDFVRRVKLLGGRWVRCETGKIAEGDGRIQCP